MIGLSFIKKIVSNQSWIPKEISNNRDVWMKTEFQLFKCGNMHFDFCLNILDHLLIVLQSTRIYVCFYPLLFEINLVMIMIIIKFLNLNKTYLFVNYLSNLSKFNVSQFMIFLANIIIVIKELSLGQNPTFLNPICICNLML